MRFIELGLLVGVLSATACDDRGNDEIIFYDGRAVEAVDDSVLAATHSPEDVLLVLNLTTNHMDSVGGGVLNSPFHVQYLNGRWYVSDILDGRPLVRVFQQKDPARFELERTIDLSEYTSLHHQFAVLPDGRIVVEANDNRLVVISADSATAATFTLTDVGPRPSIIVAASGGVLHAVPDKHLTLYNAFGHIRWRTEWPWSEDAFVTDIAIDAKSRIHVLAGIPDTGDGLFRVYSLVGETGEVVWWSDPGERATFSVSLFGDVTPDNTGRWF